MSIDLDWSLLTKELGSRLHERVNAVLSGIELPDYLGAISLRSLDLGSDAPSVRLTSVQDVWSEFHDAALHGNAVPTPSVQPPNLRLRTFRQYNDEIPTPVDWDARSMSEADESMASSGTLALEDLAVPTHAPRATGSLTSLPDAQFHLGIHWPTTSVRAMFSGSLQMYYSDARLLSLPFTLTLTGLELIAEVVLAFDPDTDAIYVSLMDDSRVAAQLETPDPRQPKRRQSQTARILPYLTFDSRVGEPEKHVLENVGKVEKFAGDVIRQLLESELVYPNFYTIQLQDTPTAEKEHD